MTLCFAKTKVLNSSFKPKLNLDPKIQFQTNAQFDFGFKQSFKLGLKPSLKPSFRSTAILKKADVAAVHSVLLRDVRLLAISTKFVLSSAGLAD